MPRFLVWVLIFLLVIFVMPRACGRRGPDLPPAVSVEGVAEEEGEPLERDGTVARLAADGSVVSLQSGEETILRPVPPWRRVFQLRLREGGNTLRIGPEWKRTPRPGGAEYRWSQEGLELVKRLTLGPGGLRIELEIVTGPEVEVQADLTLLSGVPPGGEEAERPGGALFRSGENLEFFSFARLRRAQERDRQGALGGLKEEAGAAPAASFVGWTKDRLTEGRFGLLGRDHYVGTGLAEAQGPVSVTLEAYRTRGEESEQDEIEGWATLDCAAASTRRAVFELSWRDRAAFLATEPRLAKKPPPKPVELQNDTLLVRLTPRGAAITEAFLKDFVLEPGQEPGPGTWVPILRNGVDAAERTLALALEDPRRYGFREPVEEAVWKVVERSGTHARLELVSDKGWRLEKVVELPPEGKHALAVQVRVVRPEGSDETSLGYSLTAAAGAYIEDSFRDIIGQTQPAAIILERTGGDDESEALDSLKKQAHPKDYATESEWGRLKAIGIRGTYFLVALVTESRRDAYGAQVGDVSRAELSAIRMTAAVPRPDGESSRDNLRARISALARLDGGEAVHGYRLYLGPTSRAALEEIDCTEAVDYRGLDFIALALMGIMKFFYGLFGSMGLAIMLMTVVVRGALSPVSYKNMVSMQRYSKRIQKIKPLLDELEKKYGKNKDKLNKERMRVMREHKIGLPLGCLMILLQLPIWIALFGSLRVEFVLRHAPFLWITDLSMPDRLFPIGVDLGLFKLSHFNLLPILMLVLWVWQQRAQPTPTDPQMQGQMKMFKLMPYLFFFFLYKYAAALALYMCVSSVWGIVEGKLVRRAIARMD
ncbi:MAG: membrane protein insertase YidC [Planctomycetota bacterium]